MKPIVSISGTSRPDNYTARALAVVNDKLRESGAEIIEFDARQLELNFPGHTVTEDAHRFALPPEPTEQVRATFCGT